MSSTRNPTVLYGVQVLQTKLCQTHFAYAITDDLLGGFPVQADQGPPDLEPIRSGPSSPG